MFIPSMYKSTPQLIAALLGANVITSVNKDYTKISAPGFKNMNQSGFVGQQQWGARLTSNTNLQVEGLSVASVGTQGINILVEEFLPLFFRQAFHYATITILSGSLTGTYNSGLTLGAKAHILSTGSKSGVLASSGGLAVAQAQVNAELTIDLGTGIVTATRDMISYDTGGDLTLYFLIIDPK